jgi:hypothetical protein
MFARKPTILAAVALTCACTQGRNEAARQDTAALSAAAPAADATGASQTDALSRITPTTPTAASDTATGAPPPSTDPKAVPEQQSAMLIRTGEAQVEVDSIEAAAAQVRALAQRVGGYVASSSTMGGRDETRRAKLELKIPAARWDQAVTGLNPVGKVESLSVETEDVGEEFVDVQARVANARRLETRLIALLDTRTGKLDDVLQVERELARVREEIERYEGRLRYLSTRVATSTLTVNLHEPEPIVGGPGGSVLGGAFREAWRNFVGFLAGFIASLGFLVPLALLIAAAWWAVRRARRRTSPPAPAPAPADKPRLEP